MNPKIMHAIAEIIATIPATRLPASSDRRSAMSVQIARSRLIFLGRRGGEAAIAINTGSAQSALEPARLILVIVIIAVTVRSNLEIAVISLPFLHYVTLQWFHSLSPILLRQFPNYLPVHLRLVRHTQERISIPPNQPRSLHVPTFPKDVGSGRSHAPAANAGDARGSRILAEQGDHCSICGRIHQVLEVKVPLSGGGIAIGIEADLRNGLAGHGERLAVAPLHPAQRVARLYAG